MITAEQLASLEHHLRSIVQTTASHNYGEAQAALVHERAKRCLNLLGGGIVRGYRYEDMTGPTRD